MATAPERTTSWDDFVQTGPGTPMGELVRRYWQPVALSSDIAAGEAVPVRIMGEDLTLYRGQSGQAHLISDRCAHRGTTLSVGWVEGDCVRCFYHGWKYDASGQCVEMPAEAESFAAKIRIDAYRMPEVSRAASLAEKWLSPSTTPSRRCRSGPRWRACG